MRGGSDETLQGRCVLVVEDEMLIAWELESLLERRGCAVIGPAKTAAHALALLDHERPDCAMLDFNLNGHTAMPVVTALKAQDVPFVLVTGHGKTLPRDPELQDAPRLDKPVDHKKLVHTLARVLEPS